MKVAWFMKYIERKHYLDRLRGLKNTPDIKIITGIRRSGKSELMRAFINDIKITEENANIIYIDYYNLEFDDIKNYKQLNEFVEKSYNPDKTNYLFVDEVQLCNQFEKAINSLHNSRKYDIYVTGSNAFLLSSDLTTLFTGRFIEIPVFPFSFSEYIQYYSEDSLRTDKLFDDYVVKGGLAGSYEYKNETDRIAYLKDVYTTIVNRDLVDKYHLGDANVLNHLAEFLMDNIANLSSPNGIAKDLNTNQVPTNHVTVGKYINYLCNAFMFYNIKRYDIKGKKYLETSEKYYLADTGLRYAILGTRNMDYGRAYENLVAIDLLRRGYNVYIGKLYQKEIDFVATRGSEKIYIQVSDNITQDSTFEREVKSLLQIKDAYPKILIANTGHPEYQYEGIRIINIADWLLAV